MANRDLALSLAAHGLHVFPCHGGGPDTKKPLRAVYWRKASSTDPQQVYAWWDRFPDAVPGIDLAKAGLLVIDADRHGGPDGVAAWQALCSDHDCPPHPIVQTPSGGEHSLFRQPAGGPVLGNSRGNLPPGIDVRGAGGYVIAGGAVMVDGRAYRLVGDIADAPEAPPWLVALLRPPVVVNGIGFRAPLPPTADRYADAALSAEVRAVATGSKGGRNERLNQAAFSLGQLVGAGALPASDVAAHLEQAAHDCGLVADDGLRQVRATIKSGLEKGQQQPRSIPPPRANGHGDPAHGAAIAAALLGKVQEHKEKAKSDLEWFDDIAPVIDVSYVVKGLIDRGTMSVVYGPSNSGKTFFALDLVFHAAIANQWRDRKVHGGGVLYLAAEGGNGIANRIAALRATYGSVDVPLALRRAGLDLLKPEAHTAYVIALAEEVASRAPLAVIVIDTLSRAIAGGDENAATDMTAFIRNVDLIRQRTGAHLMVVHHTGKDTAKGARGHSSLRAATDTEIELFVDEFGNRVAKVTKQRDYPGGEEFRFALKSVLLGKDKDGDEVSTCVVEVADRPENSNAAPPIETCRAILEAINKAWLAGEPLSMVPQTKHSGRYAPRVLSRHFPVKETVITRLLDVWIDRKVLVMALRDAHRNLTGLRVEKQL